MQQQHTNTHHEANISSRTASKTSPETTRYSECHFSVAFSQSLCNVSSCASASSFLVSWSISLGDPLDKPNVMKATVQNCSAPLAKWRSLGIHTTCFSAWAADSGSILMRPATTSSTHAFQVSQCRRMVSHFVHVLPTNGKTSTSKWTKYVKSENQQISCLGFSGLMRLNAMCLTYVLRPARRPHPASPCGCWPPMALWHFNVLSAFKNPYLLIHYINDQRYVKT